uniref:Ig-like domain-containing protein n=1 Tax=Cyprinus carpio TaxID=7962 RepID=A0A8C1TTI6_CYPCA
MTNTCQTSEQVLPRGDVYPPKNVSVSINPSGEIVEGDSVTLSCSSDSNPPAEISWFKEATIVGSGSIYSVSKISSNHSGEYKCKSRNKHGEKDSDIAMLNVIEMDRFFCVASQWCHTPPPSVVIRHWGSAIKI